MKITSVQVSTTVLAAKPARLELKVSESQTGPAPAEGQRSQVPGQAKRWEEAGWKTERNAWQASHKPVATKEWLAACTTWMAACDASQGSEQPPRTGQGLPT